MDSQILPVILQTALFLFQNPTALLESRWLFMLSILIWFIQFYLLSQLRDLKVLSGVIKIHLQYQQNYQQWNLKPNGCMLRLYNLSSCLLMWSRGITIIFCVLSTIWLLMFLQYFLCGNAYSLNYGRNGEICRYSEKKGKVLCLRKSHFAISYAQGKEKKTAIYQIWISLSVIIPENYLIILLQALSILTFMLTLSQHHF